MEENTNNAIFTLMQKVVDKLDAISKDVSNIDQTELSHVFSEENEKLKNLIETTISNQHVLDQKILSKKEIDDSIKENAVTPNVNNYTEFSLLGSKSHFKPKTLIIMLFSLLIIWSSIKYLPSYFMEKNSISKAKEDYQIFYNYFYFKEFEKNKNAAANEILKKIIQKDPIFMEEYQTLLSTYQREIKKQELKEQLNALDNNDR
ncbi:hypothetical protein SAMN05216503_2281 [Polaribacter sp. KT25b]|uniref:hypothetical protein n=1 Tax=Polaribacter sp. KT25b TaxID=1855336 RepID=UPI00087A14BC|nr:hypothetical protein [Polaribacter sp. KT25b]SDS19577.1 hypothetical protein SAMN05216503_2281 [Polaribacter sp. KT25b]